MSSKLEERLAEHLALMSRSTAWPYPEPVREFHPMWCCELPRKKHTNLTHTPILYHHTRDFRVDFAWPAQRVIVECEGVRWDAHGGQHQTGAGFTKDLDKYTQLELAGWRVIRIGRREITSGAALALIEKALEERHVAAG